MKETLFNIFGGDSVELFTLTEFMGMIKEKFEELQLTLKMSAMKVQDGKQVDTKESNIQRLIEDDTLIINKEGHIVGRPAPNSKCPCKSKYRYRKCQCSESDRERREAYIANKLIDFATDENKFKSQLPGGLI